MPVRGKHQGVGGHTEAAKAKIPMRKSKQKKGFLRVRPDMVEIPVIQLKHFHSIHVEDSRDLHPREMTVTW